MIFKVYWLTSDNLEKRVCNMFLPFCDNATTRMFCNWKVHDSHKYFDIFSRDAFLWLVDTLDAGVKRKFIVKRSKKSIEFTIAISGRKITLRSLQVYKGS